MSGLVAGGVPTSAPVGVAVRTFLEDGEARFAPRGARTRVNELIIHESVTRSAATTIPILKRRGLSAHLLLGPEGVLTQHGDLVRDVFWHAGRVHNAPSFAVEVINPYYPRLLKKGLPWSRTIDAPWAHGDAYVLPTPAQAEAVASLVRWATSAPAPGVVVPRVWPGLVDGRMALGRLENGMRRSPGIQAHHYFGHADGAWLVLYAWLRIEAELSPSRAFEEAVRRAEGARRSADVRELISAAKVA